MVFHVVTLFYFCSEISRNEKRDLSMVRSFEVLFGFVRRVWSFDGLYEFPGVVGISMGYVGALRSPVSLLALLMFRTPEVIINSFSVSAHFQSLSLISSHFPKILLNQTFLSHQPTNMPQGGFHWLPPVLFFY